MVKNLVSCKLLNDSAELFYLGLKSIVGDHYLNYFVSCNKKRFAPKHKLHGVFKIESWVLIKHLIYEILGETLLPQQPRVGLLAFQIERGEIFIIRAIIILHTF